MAKSSKDLGGGRSEWMQILLLTLTMTGGGFLLLYLIFVWFMIPGKQDAIALETRRLKDLTKLLDEEEMKILRQKERDKKESGEGAKVQTLLQIISDKLRLYGLDGDITDRSRERQGVVVRSYKLSIKPAPMDAVLKFMVSVVGSKKNINVQNLRLDRSRRGRLAPDQEPEDSWKSDLEFVEYVSKS